MAGGVAGGGEQADLVGHRVFGGDEVGEARVQDRLDGVGEVAGVVAAVDHGVLQVLVLRLAHQVAGVGKGRDPLAVHQPGVPAGVVEVQVGAQHRVDALGRTAHMGDVFQEAGLQVVEHGEVPGPIVAQAGVDHDAPVAGPDDEGLERDHHLAFGRAEVGKQPVVLAQQLGRTAFEQHRKVVGEAIDLDNPADLDIADLPLPDVLNSHVVLQRR